MKVHLVAAGKYHDIDFARLELLKLLAEIPQVRTTVAADYAATGLIEGSRLLVTYTCDLTATPGETAALARWLDGGGRWLALHGTNSLLRFTPAGTVEIPTDDTGFMKLIGTQFAGHPPIGRFAVQVTRDGHAMTAGLRDFQVVDELYLTNRTAEIDVLLHTAFSGSCPEFGDRAWDDRQVPVLYERKVGRGAIMYLTLGHCRGHYDLRPLAHFYPHPERCAWNYPIFYELLRRGIRWGLGDEAV